MAEDDEIVLACSSLIFVSLHADSAGSSTIWILWYHDWIFL